MRSYTLITGASSGLGRSLAVVYARKSKDLILVSMPGSGLSQLSRQISEVYQVDVKYYECNLSDLNDLKSLLQGHLLHLNIDCLINNVGIGGSGNFLSSSLSELYLMIDLNLKSAVTLTYSLLPKLLEHSQPRIINISSIAGVAPVAYKTIYPACKSFIRAFSCSLNEEFRDKGLCISTVFPGPMATNTNTTERIVKQGFKAKFSLCATSYVANYIAQHADGLKQKIIPGVFNRIQYSIAQLLPEVLISKWISKTIKNELSL
jgi:short-subunit dehydrogenase